MAKTLEEYVREGWATATDEPSPEDLSEILARLGSWRCGARSAARAAGRQAAQLYLAKQRAITNRVARTMAQRDAAEKTAQATGKARDALVELLQLIEVVEMSELYAQALLARYTLGLERAELAAFLGCTEDNAYQRISRGKKVLKKRQISPELEALFAAKPHASQISTPARALVKHLTAI